MASTTIKQLEIRPETSWCEIDTSVGLPAADSTLTGWQTVEFIDASQVTVMGESKQDPGSAARAGYYTNPAEPLIATGDIPCKSGTMTLDFYLRPSGTNANSDDGLRALFGTRMVYDDASLPTPETVSSVTLDSTGSHLTMGAATSLAAGDVILMIPSAGGVAHYGFVVSASGTSVDTTPALPAGVSIAFAQKLSQWKIPTASGDPVYNGVSSPSCTIRAIGDGWKSVAYGCTLTGLTLTGTGDDTRAVHCTATIDLAFVIDSTGSFTPMPVTDPLGGRIEHSLASPLLGGVTKTLQSMMTADDSGDGNDSAISGACVDEWTLTLTWTCDTLNCGSFWIGRGPLEASALECTLQTLLAKAAGGTGSTDTLMDSILPQWEQGKLRSLILGFDASAEDGSSNNGTGGCIALLGAGIQDGSFLTIDEGKGFQRVSVTWNAGPYGRLSTASDNIIFALAIGG